MENTPLDFNAAGAVLSAIDARFSEIGGHIDGRVAELEIKIKGEMDSLDAQQHALAEGVETRIGGLRGEIAGAVAAQRQGIDADLRGLRAQMTVVHKEFAETLARLMDEQIFKTIAARMESVEEKLRQTIREEVGLNGKDPQIAELSARVDSQDRNMLELVKVLGLQAVERMTPGQPPAPLVQPAPPSPEPLTLPAQSSAAPPTGAGAAPPNASLEPAPDLPAFAGPRKPLWRVPTGSSFLIATGSLLLLHYR